MNRKISTRLLSAALVLLMALALAAPAMAATSYVIATDDTIVREGPGTNYDDLGTLEEGEVVVKSGTAGTWTRIIFDDEYGYVKTADIDDYDDDDDIIIIDDEGPAASSTTVYASANVNVRSGPGTNYSKLGELKKGEAVKKVGTTGNWTIINWKTGTAYVSSSYLTSSGSSGGSTTTGTTMAATANVNVRSGPGTNYSLVGYLTKGTKVTKTGTSGNWTKINYNGTTAYVYSSYLAVSSSGGSTTTDTLLYATEDDVPVRTGPSTAYRAIGYLDEGDSIAYLGTSGTSWYKVQFGSNVAYVHASDMWFKSSGGSSSTGGLVYASSTVRVYEQPSTASDMLGYLYAGETAERTGRYSTGWTRIEYDGETGYVQTSRVYVITDTDSTDSMTSVNKWMAAYDDKTYVYSVPSAVSTYREGYLDEDERVWVLAKNSTWARILIDEDTYYVPLSDLYSTSSGGSSNTGKYSIGSYVYVAKYKGADTYANSSRSPLIVENDDGHDVEYGELSRGTRLTVKGQVGSMLLVSFRDDRDTSDDDYTGKTYSAYVDIDLVTDIRP